MLVAISDDMRQEVIAQEQVQRRIQEEAPTDTSNAEDMDNAIFFVSLAPDFQEEIIITAVEGFIISLSPDMQGKSQILRKS